MQCELILGWFHLLDSAPFLGATGGKACTGFVTLISTEGNAKLPLSNQLPRTTPQRLLRH